MCSTILIIVLAVTLACKERAIRDVLNKQNGYISDGMKRVVITPRQNMEQKAIDKKISYAYEDSIWWSDCEYDEYWNEEGKVHLSAEADQMLMEATFELHNMALTAVDKVVNDDKLLYLFGINRKLWPAIKKSWAEK